jgi:hypothetical protein
MFPEEVANTVRNHIDSIISSKSSSTDGRHGLEQIEEEDDSDFITMMPVKVETSPRDCFP